MTLDNERSNSRFRPPTYLALLLLSRQCTSAGTPPRYSVLRIAAADIHEVAAYGNRGLGMAIFSVYGRGVFLSGNLKRDGECEVDLDCFTTDY